jgi:hypothetical protein
VSGDEDVLGKLSGPRPKVNLFLSRDYRGEESLTVSFKSSRFRSFLASRSRARDNLMLLMALISLNAYLSSFISFFFGVQSDGK